MTAKRDKGLPGRKGTLWKTGDAVCIIKQDMEYFTNRNTISCLALQDLILSDIHFPTYSISTFKIWVTSQLTRKFKSFSTASFWLL